MSQNPGPIVPWGFLGLFLADAKKRVEDALVVVPGAKLSYLEITLYPGGEEAPTEEYNLSSGEVGQRLVPDDQIVDDGEEESLEPVFQQERVSAKKAFRYQMRIILRPIRLWLLRFLEREETGSNKIDSDAQDTASQNVYQPSDADALVRKKLFDIRNELAGKPEVDGFAVGVRALVTASPTGCSGYRCEYRLLVLGWRLRRYYSKLDGTCGKRWTGTVCTP
jgi:hypothetical protein